MRRWPEPAVSFTLFVNTYAAIAGFVIATTMGRPSLAAVLATLLLLGLLGGFAFLVVLIGVKSEAVPRPHWQAWLVQRPITAQEMFLLLGCVVLDVGVVLLLALFALPASLLPPPTCPCFP